MSSLENLYERLDSTREQLLMSLEWLPDEALLLPGVIGDWSIAGLISILTAWDAELVTGLMRLKQGRAPEALLAALADPAAYNAGRYQENLDRDLDGIFEDFQGARVQLEDWLEGFQERDFTDPNRFKPLRGRTLSDLVSAGTYKHEARYLPRLKAFAREWEAAEAEAMADDAGDEADELFIPLGGVDILSVPGQNGDSKTPPDEDGGENGDSVAE